MADTIHIQPELTGELSTEELLKALKLAIDSFPPAHPDAEGMSCAQYEVTLELRKARAAIAADRARRQPEPGEVQELVGLIRQIALAWEPDAALLGNMTAGQLARAADLLERLSPPQPVPVSEWRTIDTAPKDGTEILASDYDAVEILSWYKGNGDRGIPGEWINRDGEAFYPAWWQPLPDHPALPLPGEVEAR